ncbi:MAG: TonB-dependent siderophore receptor [Burkholderiaceae bacterium]
MTRLTPIASALLALSTAPAAWSQATPPTSIGTTVAAASASAPGGVQSVTVEGAASTDFGRNGTSLSKLPADLHDVPQSITVLSKSLLQSQGAASLADALRNVPGITLGGAEGGQIGNNINLNGFTARTDIYLDGFRDRGQYYRDTFALDSVEVLMGPSSMLFGRGSTGGVINQVSKAPQRKAVTEVDASVTTNGMARTTADIGRPIDATSALRVAVMAQHGAPTTRDEMKNTDFGIAPSLKLGIGTPTEITLSALLQRNHDMPDYGVSPYNGRPVNVPRDTFYGYEDDRTNQEVATFSALVSHRFGADTTLRNEIQSNSVHVDARETASQSIGVAVPSAVNGFRAFTSADPFSSLSVKLQSHDRVINDHSVFDQLDLSTRLDTGPLHHELLAGGELGQDTYSNQSYTRTGSCGGVTMAAGFVGCESLTHPVYADTPANAPDVKTNLSRSTADSSGLYLSDTLSLGPRFKLVAGVRRDWFDAKIANSIPSATTPKSVSQNVAFTSYRAGGIWQPTLAQSYYASYSTSFNPSLEQLTNTTGATSPLPPETNKAFEAGGKVDLLNGTLSLNGAAFQITKDNARSADAGGNYTATGTVRVRGARVGGSGLVSKGWKAFAGVAYLDAKIIDGVGVGTQGKVPANTPRGSATLWTTYEFMPHWELGGGGVYQSRRYASNTDAVQVGGYARWDGTLAYRQPRYDVRLNVFNIGDRKYYDALIPSDGGRAVPGTGRSAMLSVSYHL